MFDINSSSSSSSASVKNHIEIKHHTAAESAKHYSEMFEKFQDMMSAQGEISIFDTNAKWHGMFEGFSDQYVVWCHVEINGNKCKLESRLPSRSFKSYGELIREDLIPQLREQLFRELFKDSNFELTIHDYVR